ncbi:MAG: ice-binding family protein [Anaerolineales bacterium]
MIKPIYRSFSNAARLVLMAVLAMALALGSGQVAHAAVARAPVDLGAATHFAILTKTGITNVPTSAITGDIGVSPAAATYITGFSVVADSTNVFSRSAQVTGKIYAANYAVPSPANMTTAISNMQTAYTDAAGRSIPDFTELYAGNLSGKTLVPGLYKWGTGVLITTDVTLAGPANAVWIFQVAGNLTMGSGAKMLLSGGAQAGNIFWQVGGGVGVEIGTTAHVEGTLLAAKAIHLRTGASLNGRALSQTAVTLAKNTVVIPAGGPSTTKVFTSDPLRDGWVLESGENSNVGGTMNSSATTFNVGDNANNKQFRAILHFDTSSLPDMAIIIQVTLKIMKQGLVGTNPFTTHNSLLADINQPYFGARAALQVGDFQAAASRSAPAVFDATPVGNWYSAVLSDAGNVSVNRTGATQFRLRFALDDNNNLSADYMRFYSGNASMAACRPQLIVTYYVP